MNLLCNPWEQFAIWVETGSLSALFRTWLQTGGNANQTLRLRWLRHIETHWDIQVNVKNLDQSNAYQSDHIEKHVETEAWRLQFLLKCGLFLWDSCVKGDAWHCVCSDVQSRCCTDTCTNFLGTPTSSWSRVRCSSGSCSPCFTMIHHGSPWFTPETALWINRAQWSVP